MYYKEGFHKGMGGDLTGYTQYITELDAAEIPANIMCSDGAGPAYELQELAKVSGVPHNMGWRSTEIDVPQYHLSPEIASLHHWQEFRARWPMELDPAYVWAVPINEVDKDRSEWLAEFAIHYSGLTIPAGFKTAWFGWSCGEPGIGDWSMLHMLEFLRMCSQNKDKLAIALHEYSFNSMSLEASYPYPFPWQVGRFQYLFNACAQQGIANPTVLITEFGWGRDDMPDDPDMAMQQLEWAQELYGPHDDIKMVNIWYYGGEYENIFQKAVRLIDPIRQKALDTGYIPPQEPEEQEHTIHLLPQDTNISELNAVTEELHPTRSAFTYSHDVVEAVMFHSTPEGKIVLWDAHRWDFDLHEQFEWLGVTIEDRLFSDINAPPPEPPSGTYFDVEPLSQRDSRWVNEPLGQNTGHGKTIGNWGCLLVVYNMQARFLGIQQLFPDAYNSYMVDAGAFSAQYLINGALRKAHPLSIEYHGFLTRTSPEMVPQIYEYIAAGFPIPARVDFVPGTGDVFEQHWVLIVGVADDDYYVADPWTGQVALLSQVYGIPGVDVLEALFYKTVEVSAGIDLLPYFTTVDNRGPLYEVQTQNGPQQRHQTHMEVSKVFYFTKGGDGPSNPSEWEQLKYDSNFLWRFIDTSPGNDMYYTLRDVLGQDWSKWCPRKMLVNQVYEREPYVTFYRDSDCSEVYGGQHGSFIKFVNKWPTYTFFTGITLPDVIEMHAFGGGLDERYWFAKDYGLVGWQNPSVKSAISEIHAPGARPDNVREVIGCLES